MPHDVTQEESPTYEDGSARRAHEGRELVPASRGTETVCDRLVDCGLLFSLVDGVGLPFCGPSCFGRCWPGSAEIVPFHFPEVRLSAGVVVACLISFYLAALVIGVEPLEEAHPAKNRIGSAGLLRVGNLPADDSGLVGLIV